MSQLLLPGIAFTGFRSFGNSELEAIDPLAPLHLLAGPNNSGKSNVLAVAQQAIQALNSRTPLELDEGVDQPFDPDAERRFTVAVRHELTETDLDGLNLSSEDSLLGDLGELLRQSARIRNGTPGIWATFALNDDNRLVPSTDQLDHFVKATEEADGLEIVGPLAQMMTGQREGGVPGNCKRVMRALEPLVPGSLPPVQIIGAFRKIASPMSQGETDFMGLGLIERLAELQHPGTERHLRGRFDRIVEFVRVLFEDDRAQLEVPNKKDTLMVRHNDQWLPIENYGTGLQEVIILAAAATVLSDTLVCIEEPEIHLHPTLQRRLLAYLNANTDNQYLIATHSAHMLDSEGASLSAVRLSKGRSVIDAVVEPAEVAQISAELGARASDLVQANAVIWVEGPSDRVYVAGWLECLAPHFVRGVHYEIMHYGGSLLRHLAATDPAVEEFVSLPRINRNFAVLMDSDRTSRYSRIGKTKERVRKEVAQTSGTVVWTTTGYTIEDYIPHATLVNAVAAVHPETECRWKGDKYENPLGKKCIRGRASDVDKTAVAIEVMRHWSALDTKDWPHDLRKRIGELIVMIEAANEGK